MTTDSELYALAERLYPLPRTVMGPAVIQTFSILEEWMPPRDRFGSIMELHEVPVGTTVFDWTVLPDAENRRAYHPSLEEVPAYDGPLAYAECIIPGRESKEVLLSTYTCHPQMANDNVSGMVVTAALAEWLASEPRRYTYRILFAPETIGALCWLAKNVLCTGDNKYYVADMQQRIIAGYTINNCGDERAWSFVPSRKGDTLADRAARHVLDHSVRKLLRFGASILDWNQVKGWKEYSFADRGSDERQFCAPGVDLPIASVMRSKHGTYPEYHTKQDDLSVISAKGLGDSFRCYQNIVRVIEANRTYRVTTIGEPMLSRHGLYPSSGGPDERARIARDLCAYSDGTMDLLAIAEATNRPMLDLVPVADDLFKAGLLTPRD